MGAISLRLSGSGSLKLDRVCFSALERDGEPTRLVDDCSFIARRGEFTVLIGPSGCGKTTLMKLAAGYLAPGAGTIELDGVPVMGPGSDRLLVFQETALFPWMTTLENVVYGPMVQRRKSLSEIRDEASSLLDKVGLGDFKNRYPRELSGGMQRRAELARALINDPLVLLMDEPFRGLDAMTRQLMQEYLAGLFEKTRTTTIFVTSEIDEAIFLADRLVVLKRSPTSVACEMSVDLPRPRKMDMLLGDEATRIKKAALDLLYTEAVSDFESGGQVSDIKEAYERRHAI
ncbi:MAG: ABC transporter ATP-binding protein [Bradyrhizobiaceae bacterium]|nr:MAG: ABC transporter ATP-binding protein [Bradyrhizobiaceae bacterium]